MITTVKVTTKSGNSWITGINLTLEQAKDYFFKKVVYYVTENEETGTETCDKIIKVEEV